MNEEQLENLMHLSNQAAGLPKPVSIDQTVIRQRARRRREVRRAGVAGLVLLLALSLWFGSWGALKQEKVYDHARVTKLEMDMARLQAENKVLLMSVDQLIQQRQQTAIEQVRAQLYERGITNRASMADEINNGT